MANCFTCRVNGSGMCAGSCGLCGVLCPGFDDNCRETGCTGKLKNYGRSQSDCIIACDTCATELEV